MSAITEYFGREVLVTDRDEIIEYAYKLALDGMMPIDSPDYETLKLSQYDGQLLGKNVTLRYKYHVIFTCSVYSGVLRVDNKSRLNHLILNINTTEEECFQKSLIEKNSVSYDTLQQIKYLIKYCIDNTTY